jgi:hypothetical protein
MDGKVRSIGVDAAAVVAAAVGICDDDDGRLADLLPLNLSVGWGTSKDQQDASWGTSTDWCVETIMEEREAG